MINQKRHMIQSEENVTQQKVHREVKNHLNVRKIIIHRNRNAHHRQQHVPDQKQNQSPDQNQ